MNESEMSRYIIETYKGVDVVVASDNSFFFYNPDPNVPPDHMFPFATIVTSDDSYDNFSNLNRPSVYRLNIGVSKETFRALFGKPVLPSDNAETAESDGNSSEYDFTAVDQLLPHPVYGRQYWLCIINPSEETFETKVRPLLNEAYEMAVSKYNKKANH